MVYGLNQEEEEKAVEIFVGEFDCRDQSNQRRGIPTMSKDKQEGQIGLPEIGVSLDELVRRGARHVIHQAIEAELVQLLEPYANVKTLVGKQAVVRNGYLPEREVLTAAGPVTVKVPKVRDRSGSGVKFNSANRAAVRAEIAAGIGRAAVAVSERDLDWRHERGTVGAPRRRSEGSVGERGQPAQGAVG